MYYSQLVPEKTSGIALFPKRVGIGSSAPLGPMSLVWLASPGVATLRLGLFILGRSAALGSGKAWFLMTTTLCRGEGPNGAQFE